MESRRSKQGGARGGFMRFAWATVAYNVAVILWGALVRATGSGAGCGNHWPLCNGAVTEQSPEFHKFIEFTHRMMTGADGFCVVLLVVWAFRAYPRGHAVRTGATLSGVFLVTEALLGALLVLSGHVAQSADPYSSSMHFVNTLTLLACLALTAWWSMDKPVPHLHGKAAWMAAFSLGAVMLLGVTGAIAALGDTLFPASSLAAGLAQDFNPSSNFLLRLRALHPAIAAGVAAWLTYFAVGSLRVAKAEALRVIVVVWVQLLAGLLNFLLRAPVWMQLVHLLIADVLWISLVVLCASLPSEVAQKSSLRASPSLP